MRRIDCEKAQEWIVADLDDTLDDDLRQRLYLHLLSCRKCRDARIAFKKIWSLLESDVPEDPGQAFWENYYSSFRTKLAKAPERQNRNGVFWGIGWRAAAVLVPLAIVLLPVLFSPVEPTSIVPETGRAANQKLLVDLHEVYGPTSEETAPTALAAYVGSGNTNLPSTMGLAVKWFEVEDEAGPPFL